MAVDRVLFILCSRSLSRRNQYGMMNCGLKAIAGVNSVITSRPRLGSLCIASRCGHDVAVFCTLWPYVVKLTIHLYLSRSFGGRSRGESLGCRRGHSAVSIFVQMFDPRY